MFETLLLIIEALEAVYWAVYKVYERFFPSSDEENDDSQQSDVDQR